MDRDGHIHEGSTRDAKLHWPERVLSALDLRQHLNGQSEIVVQPRTIITPEAIDELRRNGTRVTRQAEAEPKEAAGRWAYAQDRMHPVVSSAAQALAREGFSLQEVETGNLEQPCRWVRRLAELVCRGDYWGIVAFCEDASLLCCVANKVIGIRAIVGTSVAQVSRTTKNVSPNFVGIEVPGRTFFELKQILRAVCSSKRPACPADLASVLQEPDTHAHR